MLIILNTRFSLKRPGTYSRHLPQLSELYTAGTWIINFGWFSFSDVDMSWLVSDHAVFASIHSYELVSTITNNYPRVFTINRPWLTYLNRHWHQWIIHEAPICQQSIMAYVSLWKNPPWTMLNHVNWLIMLSILNPYHHHHPSPIFPATAPNVDLPHPMPRRALPRCLLRIGLFDHFGGPGGLQRPAPRQSGRWDGRRRRWERDAVLNGAGGNEWCSEDGWTDRVFVNDLLRVHWIYLVVIDGWFIIMVIIGSECSDDGWSWWSLGG